MKSTKHILLLVIMFIGISALVLPFATVSYGKIELLPTFLIGMVISVCWYPYLQKQLKK